MTKPQLRAVGDPIDLDRLARADRLVRLSRMLLTGCGASTYTGIKELHGSIREPVLRAAAILAAAGASLIVDEAGMLPDDEDDQHPYPACEPTMPKIAHEDDCTPSAVQEKNTDG